MSARFSGRDVVKVLRKHDYEFVTRTGSHIQMRDVTDDGEVRNVTVPLHDELDTGTLHSIADQCGANDFAAFCEWIDKNR
ncbi:YcfA family protein [Halorhabdus tiamatea SARL4B]|uniref:HicA mRNA interferase family protein n=1 Tax=Halorhabdus tiamatea SARL4B TaxID=1033806 RepID=F7PFM6_9EURY|nr:type II toxin-antitoxin system HicA family toxin [Halorhabdus tiamatea]ERJ06445.1 YcfA family protein [Halorhabdus tiamatea SARL4B]CCQ34315.1 HicA mRNA interferase family protein [Halorhabdus tiamatea SARL4B]